MSGLNPYWYWILDIGWQGVLDITIVTLVFYSLLVWLKRTQRAVMVLAGILIVGAVYLAALKFNLPLTGGLLHYFFTVFLVALVVIFQEELRYGFEQIALWWWNRGLPLSNRKSIRLPRREVDILGRTLFDLARERIGALIVIRGKDLIARHLDGGEEVRGLLSEPLLKSIFDPHSIGHDGAVIIEGGFISKLGVHLPLSRDHEKLPRGGTRHAAALGLSEVSDALCLVVSEERGVVSAARQGEIHRVADAAELVQILETFYEEIEPRPVEKVWPGFWRKNTREKLAAFLMALLLWLGSERRSQITQDTFALPIAYNQLSTALVITATNPPAVNVTFSGPRRAFQFLNPRDIRLVVDLRDAQAGDVSIQLSSIHLTYPPDLQLEDLEPRQIQLKVALKPPKPNNPN